MRTDSEDEHQGLMTTPQSEEELNLRLDKLCVPHVPRPRKVGLRYELTRTLVALARQTSRLKKLKDVLEAAEFEEALAKAESRDWACPDAEMPVLGEVAFKERTQACLRQQ